MQGVRLELVHDQAELVDFLSGPPDHAEHPRSARNPVPRTVSGTFTPGYPPVLARLKHDPRQPGTAPLLRQTHLIQCDVLVSRETKTPLASTVATMLENAVIRIERYTVDSAPGTMVILVTRSFRREPWLSLNPRPCGPPNCGLYETRTASAHSAESATSSTALQRAADRPNALDPIAEGNVEPERRAERGQAEMLRAELSLWLATETMAARPLLICWGKWSALRADTALLHTCRVRRRAGSRARSCTSRLLVRWQWALCSEKHEAGPQSSCKACNALFHDR